MEIIPSRAIIKLIQLFSCKLKIIFMKIGFLKEWFLVTMGKLLSVFINKFQYFKDINHHIVTKNDVILMIQSI